MGSSFPKGFNSKLVSGHSGSVLVTLDGITLRKQFYCLLS